MKRRLGPGRISPPTGFEVGSANRSATRSLLYIYTHDGHADKNPYPHDRRADKDTVVRTRILIRTTECD